MAWSPLDMMIDKACGFDPSAPRPPRDTVTLRCPVCKSEKIVDRHKTDPQGTAVVESACLACLHSGDFDTVNYFSADGRQIDLDGNVL